MSPPTPDNPLLFQSFEWHTPSEPPVRQDTYSATSHWTRLARVLPSLADLGVTSLWLPPGCKANDPMGNGYDCYDWWDLGEFDQKVMRSTKWGSREELQRLIQVAERRNVDVIWDAVLNHKTAGDATDDAWAVEVDKEDRRIEICAPKKISAWLRYDFPGREREGMKYSTMRWRAEHFNGTDWDQNEQKLALFKLIDDPATCPKPTAVVPSNPTSRARSGFGRFARMSALGMQAEPQDRQWAKRPGKDWAEDVDKTYGNYDYLLFSNIWYRHSQVRDDALKWGEWMIQDIGMHGFRLDAAQHISYNFTRDWITRVHDASRRRRGKGAFVIGEIWTTEVSKPMQWLDAVTPPGSQDLAFAFDSPLLYTFSRVSEDVRTGSKNADLRTLLSGPAGFSDRQALVYVRPEQAVTCVTNHDTQPGQASCVPMESNLKPLFYAFILLRREGYPCAFWGDLFGTRGPTPETPIRVLPRLMLARRLFAYGTQKDYFSQSACIGWTRSGTHDRPGCAVLISIAERSKYLSKRMIIGRPGEIWVNVLSWLAQRQEVLIDKKGRGVFTCPGMEVAVFVNQEALALHQDLLLSGFDFDVYKPR